MRKKRSCETPRNQAHAGDRTLPQSDRSDSVANADLLRLCLICLAHCFTFSELSLYSRRSRIQSSSDRINIFFLLRCVGSSQPLYNIPAKVAKVRVRFVSMCNWQRMLAKREALKMRSRPQSPLLLSRRSCCCVGGRCSYIDTEKSQEDG